MEPVSAALLLALAGSVGSSAGQQAWDALSALVRRPFHRTRHAEQTVVPSGQAHWSALAQDPQDQERARQLSAALAARAEADPAFAQALDAWHWEARRVLVGSENTHNTITGGQHSAVVQARDIHGGITFGSSTPPSHEPGDRSAPEASG